MSLQEFFSDESYGGSWADDEIDIASISVPIEKNRGYGYGGDSHYGAGGSRFGSTGGHGRSAFLDNGPPYIVKLSNIPVTSNDAFISDLFQSRFTPLVKFKILFDPLSHPLESGIVKKMAFVELPTFESMKKVSNWQDVVYKGSRRVAIEVADFSDFQESMRFNQENHQELLRVEETFLSSRPRPGHNDEAMSGRRRLGMGRSPGGMPLDNIPLPGSRHHFGPQSRDRRLSNNETQQQHTPSIPHIESTAPRISTKPKPNPFGSAKPVDVLARSQEIEKNIITYKHTTVRAPWVDGNDQSGITHGDKIPEGVSSWNQSNGPKKSLADILGSSKAKDHTKNPRAASASSTPKPVVKKPTVLMKKAAVWTPEPQAQVQENSNQGDGNVDSVATKLSHVSIEPKAPESLPADSKYKSAPEQKENSSSQPASSENQPSFNTETLSTSETGTASETSKPSTKNMNERKAGTRRRSNRGRESVYTSEVEGPATSHAFTERRQRRSSNRTSERRPSANGPVIAPPEERESKVSERDGEIDEVISNNTIREPRARRSNRWQSMEKDPTSASTRTRAGSSGVSERLSAASTSEKPSSSPNSGATNEESSRGSDSNKRGNRHNHSHSRGRGQGRGGVNGGRRGSEAKGNEERIKAGDGKRKDNSRTKRKEAQKSDNVGNS